MILYISKEKNVKKVTNLMFFKSAGKNRREKTRREKTRREKTRREKTRREKTSREKTKREKTRSETLSSQRKQDGGKKQSDFSRIFSGFFSDFLKMVWNCQILRDLKFFSAGDSVFFSFPWYLNHDKICKIVKQSHFGIFFIMKAIWVVFSTGASSTVKSYSVKMLPRKNFFHPKKWR